jgi:hypothetical protein
VSSVLLPPSPESLPTRGGTLYSGALRAYFYSGWAFLIPYLVLYLLYYWQKWPANPSIDLPLDSSHPPSTAFGLPVPPLLDIYRALHVLHFALAVLAIRSWRNSKAAAPDALSVSKAVRAVTPWLLLAFIFYLPGVYLEWPSDPWEHLRRINEWQNLASVGNHSAGYKAFYFFSYSLVGRLSSEGLLYRLAIYYTGICLLIGWQYYLLARAVRLERPWAFLFVVVNALTFGNSVFSFYRYYGISSTMFAQLGAVAITRIALDILNNIDDDRHAFSHADFGPWSRLHTGYPLKRSIPARALGVALLLGLIGANHIQGFGIASLSLIAIIGWRVWIYKRIVAIYIGVILALLSASAVYIGGTTNTLLLEYRQHGWLAGWYGFNIFQFNSSAGAATYGTLSWFGVGELVAILWLITRGSVVGWLGLIPLLALALPAIAVPFTLAIASSPNGEIVTFQRLLFALPIGLPTIAAAAKLRPKWRKSPIPPGVIVLMLVCLPLSFVVLSGTPGGTRVWHLLERSPDDLNFVQLDERLNSTPDSHDSSRPLTAVSSVGFVGRTFGHSAQIAYRLYAYYGNFAPTNDLNFLTEAIRTRKSSIVCLARPFEFYTPASQSAMLTKHWWQHEASLSCAGTPELLALLALETNSPAR